MHIGHYVELVHKGQQDLVEAYLLVAQKHGDEPDVLEQCKLQAGWSMQLAEKLEPFAQKYREEKDEEPDRLLHQFFKANRKGVVALLRDLHDLWLMASEAQVSAVILRQAASGIRDESLITVCDEMEETAQRQLSWLLTRMKSAAPQILIAAA